MRFNTISIVGRQFKYPAPDHARVKPKEIGYPSKTSDIVAF
jgi:hypothetical protein